MRSPGSSTSKSFGYVFAKPNPAKRRNDALYYLKVNTEQFYLFVSLTNKFNDRVEIYYHQVWFIRKMCCESRIILIRLRIWFRVEIAAKRCGYGSFPLAYVVENSKYLHLYAALAQYTC
jgi:hypothetical protein